LIAESYSGPLALRFAAAHAQRVAAVVLCASFISAPMPQYLKFAVGRWMFWIRPPRLALRALMLGRGVADEIVTDVSSAIAMVRPAVMARRIRDVCELDCEEALLACRAPLMYLAATRDRLVGRRSLDNILLKKPDVKVCNIDGPHLLLQAEPGKSWEGIASFLNDLQTGAGTEVRKKEDRCSP
jgi:pimeloyl-ACP methyl ester carboxylesterase